MQVDLDALSAWIGKTESRDDTITAFPANALAATLNRDDPDYAISATLPPLWHWLYFLDVF